MVGICPSSKSNCLLLWIYAIDRCIRPSVVCWMSHLMKIHAAESFAQVCIQPTLLTLCRSCFLYSLVCDESIQPSSNNWSRLWSRDSFLSLKVYRSCYACDRPDAWKREKPLFGNVVTIGLDISANVSADVTVSRLVSCYSLQHVASCNVLFSFTPLRRPQVY